MTKQECSEIFAKLSEYLDGDLPPDVCESMAAHIEECGPCVAFVESLRKSVALSRKAAAGIEQAELKAEVKARLAEAYEQFRASGA